MHFKVLARVPFVVSLVASLLFSAVAVAAQYGSVFDSGSVIYVAEKSGEQCARGIGLNYLDQKGFLARLNRGEQVEWHEEIKSGPNAGYEIDYVAKLSAFDPQLVMGVFASCNEHAGSNGLGSSILKSKLIEKEVSNPHHVYYKQDVNFPYDKGQYVYTNVISRLEVDGRTGFALDSTLVESSDATFSPRWVDAYVHVVGLAQGSLVVACNYMVPRKSAFKDFYKNTARARLSETGKRLEEWIKRVSANADEQRAKREYMDQLIFGK